MFEGKFVLTGLVVNKSFTHCQGALELHLNAVWFDGSYNLIRVYAYWEDIAVGGPLGDIEVGEIITLNCDVLYTCTAAKQGVDFHLNHPKYETIPPEAITNGTKKAINLLLKNHIRQDEAFIKDSVDGAEKTYPIDLDSLMLR